MLAHSSPPIDYTPLRHGFSAAGADLLLAHSLKLREYGALRCLAVTLPGEACSCTSGLETAGHQTLLSSWRDVWAGGAFV